MYTKVRLLIKTDEFVLKTFQYQLTRSFATTSITQLETLSWFDKPATMDDNHTLSGTPDGSVYIYK